MGKWLSIEVSLIEPFTKGRLSLVPGAPAEHTGTTVHNTHDLTMIGTLSLCELVRNSGKRAEGYIDCNMEHGLDNDCGTCTFNSEFGTGKTNKIEVMVYMAARTAVFFQSILLGGASIPGQSTFIECENTRINYFDGTDCNSSGTVNNCKHCDSCNTNKIPTCLP